MKRPVILTIIYLISKDQGNLEQAVPLFAEEHSIGIELHSNIKDFLSAYRNKHPRKKQGQKKYEDFESWLNRFHLVLGYWKTKKEWKEAKRQLRTWEPRIVWRVRSSNRQYLDRRLKHILGTRTMNSVTLESLKGKYLTEMKDRFKKIIWWKFQYYRDFQPVSRDRRKKLLIDQGLDKLVDSTLQYERLRLIKVLCVISEEKVLREEFSSFWELISASPSDKDNGNDVYFVNRCLEILNYRVESFDYLDFFSHCPWCRSQKIELRFFRSPAWTWSARCGREGWVVRCAGCQEDLLFDLVAMS